MTAANETWKDKAIRMNKGLLAHSGGRRAAKSQRCAYFLVPLVPLMACVPRRTTVCRDSACTMASGLNSSSSTGSSDAPSSPLEELSAALGAAAAGAPAEPRPANGLPKDGSDTVKSGLDASAVLLSRTLNSGRGALGASLPKFLAALLLVLAASSAWPRRAKPQQGEGIEPARAGGGQGGRPGRVRASRCAQATEGRERRTWSFSAKALASALESEPEMMSDVANAGEQFSNRTAAAVAAIFCELECPSAHRQKTSEARRVRCIVGRKRVQAMRAGAAAAPAGVPARALTPDGR